MATAEQTQAKDGPTTMGEFAREVFEKSPAEALELVLAENERIRLEAKANAEVTLGEHGFETANLGGVYRLGQMYAQSRMIPAEYRNNPADCAIVVQLAARWKVDPFMVFQKSYVVHGRPAIESQLAIALANASGVFEARLAYRMEGEPGTDERRCTAYATMRDTGQLAEETVSIDTAKKMGWWSKIDRNGKESSLWPKMPDLMLKYRAAMWLIRTNAPEVLMGVYAKDEAEDIGDDNQGEDDLRDLAAQLSPKGNAPSPDAEPAAPTEPTVEAGNEQSPVDEESPADEAASVLSSSQADQYCELIKGCETLKYSEATGKKGAETYGDDAKADKDLTPAGRARVLAAVNTRVREIKASRGGSTKKPG